MASAFLLAQSPHHICRPTDIIRDSLHRLRAAVEPFAADVDVLVRRAGEAELGTDD